MRDKIKKHLGIRREALGMVDGGWERGICCFAFGEYSMSRESFPNCHGAGDSNVFYAICSTAEQEKCPYRRTGELLPLLEYDGVISDETRKQAIKLAEDYFTEVFVNPEEKAEKMRAEKK